MKRPGKDKDVRIAPKPKSPKADVGRAEEALRESEERYRMLAENITDVLWVINPNSRFEYVSPSVERIHGFTVEEALKLRLEDLVVPSSMEAAAYALGAQITADEAGGVDPIQPRSAELELFRKDGTTFWAELTLIFIRDEHGNVVKAMGNTRDVTDRHKAEQALRESEARNRAFLSALPDMLFRNKADGTYLDAKAESPDELAAPPAQVIGKKIADILPPEQTAICMAGIKQALATGRTQILEYPLEIEGNKLHFEARIVSCGEDEVLTIVRNITERKRSEEEKSRLEEQLRHSQKMEAIGRLAGGIAHDFNNLLTGIIGYSELLLNSLKPEDPVRSDILEIKRASDRAAVLIQQLLGFSRRQTICPRTVDLNDLLADSERMLSRIVGEDIHMSFISKPGIWNVRVDPHQMEQVLVNLVANARDAMPHGGGLTIETDNVTIEEGYCLRRPEALPGDHCMLAVSDTGDGMDIETQARIFEPFFTTKESGKGTGLGLSTVYGIVKQNHGWIDVYSEIGSGTIFKIYLPRAKEEAIPIARRPDSALPSGTETLLLVEDEEMVRRLARRILARLGYNVIEVKDCDEACSLCEEMEGKIDLLLTDVVMPDLSGNELYERLLAIDPKLKVLYMSGFSESMVTYKGVLPEGTHFIQKPFAVESLARKVREVIDGRNPASD